MLDGISMCHAFVVTSGLRKLLVFLADLYHHDVIKVKSLEQLIQLQWVIGISGT